MDELATNELATAFHEAGHVVMARHWNRRVSFVTIDEDNERYGHIIWHGPDEAYHSRWAIALAGPIAQRCIANDASRGCLRDFDRVTEAVSAMRERKLFDNSDDEADVLKQCQQFEELVEWRVKKLMPEIIILALELLARRTMTGDEIEAVLTGESDG